MLTSRFRLSGLLAVLLALMAQLGAGASVPRFDPVAIAGELCHTDDESGQAPARAPSHSTDCLLCPLCAVVHTQTAPLLPHAPVLEVPVGLLVLRPELPPPATAPPALRRSPRQPRAPPTRT